MLSPADKIRIQKRLALHLDEREPQPLRFEALIGDGTGGDPRVPNKLNYVFVRRTGRGVIEECLNTRVAARNDLPVIVGYSHELPAVLQVLAGKWERIAELGSYAYMPSHHQAHEFQNEFGGDDVTWIQSQQLLPLLAQPTSPESMTVTVYEGLYPWLAGWHYFDGDVSPSFVGSVPGIAGEGRYSLLSIDGATETLQITDGITFPAWLPPVDYEDMIPGPPAGAIPIVAVFLLSGTTEISWDIMWDARLFAQPTGGSVTPAPHNLLDTTVHGDTDTQAPTRGSLVIANATPAWTKLIHPGTANRFLQSSATELAWVQSFTIDDNAALAHAVSDVGGIEYLRYTTTNVQPEVRWNAGGADVDFVWEAVGVDPALFVRGSDGFIGINIAAPTSLLQIGGAGTTTIRLSNTNVTHGVTNVLPTNVAGAFGLLNALTGGAQFLGISDADTQHGLQLRGILTTGATTGAAFSISATRANGIGTQALTATQFAFQIVNFTSNIFNILGDGDTYWVGDSSGLLFGSMYAAAEIIVPIAAANPVEVENAAQDGWTAGELNGVTFPGGGTEHYLTITKPGRYEILWSMSIHIIVGAGSSIHGGVMIDNVAVRDNGEAHRDIANVNDTGDMGSPCIIDLPNGNEEISLWLINDNSNNVHVFHTTVTVKQIGGT